MDFAEGFGLVGMIFLIYAAVLAFFLPFYVMGIYNLYVVKGICSKS